MTPCNWLAKLIKQSFLKDYQTKVIYNGIDLNIFRPTPMLGIREKYGLSEKTIILGVASEWTLRKGLDDFIEMSKLMQDVQFVVVGLTEEQIKSIPNSLKGIRRTSSTAELAALYSLADVFFNPTYEDNFPTTNIEALACGTPVVTYDTGGSPESLRVAQAAGIYGVGCVIEKENSKSVNYQIVEKQLRKVIQQVEDKECFKDCRKASLLFDGHLRLREYLDLYKTI